MLDWGILLWPGLEVLCTGALAGLVGAITLCAQRVFFAESTTHGAYPGAVVGSVIGAGLGAAAGESNPAVPTSLALLVGAAVTSLLFAGLARMLENVDGMTPQSTAGIVLSLGMAGGYLLAKWFQPLPLRVESYLAGSLMAVSHADVILAAVCLIAVVVYLTWRWQHLFAFAFDGIGYRSMGGNARVVQTSIIVLITVAFVILVPSVGTILPVALLVAPAATVWKWVRKPGTLLILSPVLGAVTGALGLGIATLGRLSAPGVIVLLAALLYIASNLAWHVRRHGMRRLSQPA